MTFSACMGDLSAGKVFTLGKKKELASGIASS